MRREKIEKAIVFGAGFIILFVISTIRSIKEKSKGA